MSDYRDPNDPMYGNPGYEPADRRTSTGWGWIAGAVFLVIVLALALASATNQAVSHPMTRRSQPQHAWRRRPAPQIRLRPLSRASRRPRQLRPHLTGSSNDSALAT